MASFKSDCLTPCGAEMFQDFEIFIGAIKEQ
jgi:hypothetical protein